MAARATFRSLNLDYSRGRAIDRTQALPNILFSSDTRCGRGVGESIPVPFSLVLSLSRALRGAEVGN